MKIIRIIILLSLIILTSCTTTEEYWIPFGSSERQFAESLGYKEIYSDYSPIFCSDESIIGETVLGVDCHGDYHGYRIIVAGNPNEQKKIIIVPALKKYEYTILNYNFPDLEEIKTVINNYNDSLDGPRCIKLNEDIKLNPYQYSMQKNFYENMDVDFPLYIKVGTSENNTTAFSFFVSLHTDGKARLYYRASKTNGENYNLIHVFE